MKLERRKFLGSTLGLTGATLLPSFLQGGAISSVESTGYYLMQSGNERNDNVVLWGMLEVNNPIKAAKDLESLKFENDFYARVNYSSNNKFKETICQLYFDYFEANDLKLFVKLTSKTESNFSNASPSERQATKVNFLQELTSRQKNMVRINVKSQSIYGPSVEFKEKFEAQTKVQYNPVRAKTDVIMQLNDLLVGSLRAIHLGEVKDKMKLRLNDSFKGKYRFRKFASGQNYNDKIIFI